MFQSLAPKYGWYPGFAAMWGEPLGGLKTASPGAIIRRKNAVLPFGPRSLCTVCPRLQSGHWRLRARWWLQVCCRGTGSSEALAVTKSLGLLCVSTWLGLLAGQILEPGRIQSWLCPSVAMWSCASCWTSLGLSHCIYKMGMVTVSP